MATVMHDWPDHGWLDGKPVRWEKALQLLCNSELRRIEAILPNGSRVRPFADVRDAADSLSLLDSDVGSDAA